MAFSIQPQFLNLILAPAALREGCFKLFLREMLGSTLNLCALFIAPMTSPGWVKAVPLD